MLQLTLDRKQRFLDLLAVADGTSAGFLQPFSFLEHKTAFFTFCRNYRQMAPDRMHRTFDMLEVFVDVFF